jgi:hypothetical protein
LCIIFLGTVDFSREKRKMVELLTGKFLVDKNGRRQEASEVLKVSESLPNLTDNLICYELLRFLNVNIEETFLSKFSIPGETQLGFGFLCVDTFYSADANLKFLFVSDFVKIRSRSSSLVNKTIRAVYNSVADPDSLNPDPAFQVNPVPDPGF